MLSSRSGLFVSLARPIKSVLVGTHVCVECLVIDEDQLSFFRARLETESKARASLENPWFSI